MAKKLFNLLYNMQYQINLLFVILACFIFLFFLFRRNDVEYFCPKNEEFGYAGPNWNEITNADFAKVKCIPNMNEDEVQILKDKGVVCGKNYLTWEDYDCVYHKGKMPPQCNNNPYDMNL